MIVIPFRACILLIFWCIFADGQYLVGVNRTYLCQEITWGTYAAPPWENGEGMDKTKALDLQFGRPSKIIHSYANWDDGTGDFGSWERQQWLKWSSDFASGGSESESRILMITWQPWKKNPSTNSYDAGYNFYSPSSILNGDHDSYIQSAANGLKTYGKELYLRPFHEFDGTWYSWGAQNNQAEPFKNAWRYLYMKFQEVGVRNVSFIWCPNHANGLNLNQETWYPGDEYVDWVCIDVYSDHPDVSFTDSLGKYSSPINAYQRITSITKKPILIGEFGVKSPGNAPRSKWFIQLAADLPTKLPQVKALVFFSAHEYVLDSSTSSTVSTLFGNCGRLEGGKNLTFFSLSKGESSKISFYSVVMAVSLFSLLV